MYKDEKVVCIVISQWIKCFLEERNSGSIFLDEEKKMVLNFFVLNFLANIKISADLPRSFLKGVLKSPQNIHEIGSKNLQNFSLFFVTFPQNIL